MSTRAEHLAARRERLLERSDRLRREIGENLGALRQHLHFADRVMAVGRSPWAQVLFGAGAALMILKRPRKLVRTALKFAAFYPALGPVAALIRQFWHARRRRSAPALEPPA